MVRRLRNLFVWYLAFVALALGISLFTLGKEAVLEAAVSVKPYAVIFRDGAQIRATRKKGDRLVLFFGDSSVAQPPWAPKDSPHIPALLAQELQRFSRKAGDVSVVEWAFDGARLFHYFCLLFAAQEYRPDLIVIPINWRDLGPDSWEEDPRYAFREMSSLVPVSERGQPAGRWIFAQEGISAVSQVLYEFRRPLLYVDGLKALGRDALGIAEKDPAADLLGKLPSARQLMSQFTDEKLFDFYPLDFGEENPRLQALRALRQTAALHGIRVLFYITPIHVGEMRSRRRFDETAFRRSVARVENIVEGSGSTCVNLIDLLPEDQFIDCFEHYTPAGNRAVARALAPEAARLLSEANTPPSVAAASPAHNAPDAAQADP